MTKASYILTCVETIKKYNPKFDLFITDRYTSFDADPEYRSSHSVYFYKNTNKLLINTDRCLVRMFGNDYKDKIRIKYTDNGRIEIVDFGKFMQKLGKTWGVKLPRYDEFCNNRWFYICGYKYVSLLYHYLTTGKTFRFFPDSGFDWAKKGLRSDKRLRDLKNRLIECKLLYNVDYRKGLYKFKSGSLCNTITVLFRILVEFVNDLGLTKSVIAEFISKITKMFSIPQVKLGKAIVNFCRRYVKDIFNNPDDVISNKIKEKSEEVTGKACKERLLNFLTEKKGLEPGFVCF